MEFTYPVTKSKAAFLFSVEKLFKECPAGSVYFWTFTFTKVHPDWWYPHRLGRIQKEELVKVYPRMKGLRLDRSQSGADYGLHYHALLSPRMNVNIVREKAKRCDFGQWMKAIPADKKSAYYLGKYLTKDNDLTEGMRKWGTVGGFQAIKTANIQMDTPTTRNIKWIQNEMKIKQFGYAFIRDTH